ncbi:DUF2188 domain-containing protein [Domibacillus indicus]|uniref:DUF2188 domain-containing protein n=1 Tax=Domibacillus indicus TaxID=1437523 RepID=UPI000617C67E|nr:DUF2188 domain-containing protein [Domibacillus indicus]
MGKDQHILKHEQGWQVKGSGNTKATKLFETQQEAKQFAKEKAKNQHSEVVIHGRDGRIRTKDSYGNDPFPPKG